MENYIFLLTNLANKFGTLFIFVFILSNLKPARALINKKPVNLKDKLILSVKLATAGFVVPYIFAYSPELLMINATPVTIAIVAVTAVIGVVSLAAAVEGYLISEITVINRIILFTGALLLMIPGLPTDIIGFVIFGAVVFYKKTQKRKLAI